MQTSNAIKVPRVKKTRFKKFTLQNICKDFKKNKILIVMIVPILAFYLLFSYMPMVGLAMAFEDYKPSLGILGSRFVGFQNFIDFFQSFFFVRVVKNTLIISLLQLFIEFPLTIIFALLLNEIKNAKFKRTIQTISYMPYFISMVVICGIIVDFCSSTGPITSIVSIFTGDDTSLLGQPGYWRPIYIISNLWQGIGFGSIIYIAALSSIDATLYEASTLDGANRFQQVIHVTIPGIMETIMIMLILRIGQMMSVGYEKTILLYNPQVFETADIISSFVYRKGLQEFDYGYSTAVSLFNSVINFILLVSANAFSKKYTQSGLF